MAVNVNTGTGQLAILDSYKLTSAVKSAYQNSFLTGIFFPQKQTHIETTFQVQYKVQDRDLPTPINRNQTSQINEADDWSETTITAPLISLKSHFNYEKLASRSFTEQFGMEGNTAMGQANFIADENMDKMDQLKRFIEKQVSDWFTTGTVSLATGDITYPFDSKTRKVLSGGDTWDSSTANPVQDLLDLKTEIERASGVAPNAVVMSPEAYFSLISNNDVAKTFFDSIHTNVGMNNFENHMEVASYSGGRLLGNLQIFIYSGEYTERVSGVNTSKGFVPSNMIFMGRSGIGCVEYGPLVDLYSMRNVQSEMILDSYSENDPKEFFFRLQSAPAINPKNLNAFGSMQVLA